jgi:hypothetical protein
LVNIEAMYTIPISPFFKYNSVPATVFCLLAFISIQSKVTEETDFLVGNQQLLAMFNAAIVVFKSRQSTRDFTDLQYLYTEGVCFGASLWSSPSFVFCCLLLSFMLTRFFRTAV